jgi:lysozyme
MLRSNCSSLSGINGGVTVGGNVATKAKLIALGLAGALALVPIYEGIRLKAYKDPIGIRTDCIGHTGADVNDVNTLEQCYTKFYGDLAEANKIVDSCTEVTMSSNERSAYASFAFNVGPGRTGVKDGFCILKSGNTPQHIKLLNAGQHVQACNALLLWTKAGGVVLPGLVTRRKAEQALCLKGIK